MKIKEINLYNFGSYEGENSLAFDNADPTKRVIVIGGKNGAGKTTLFTALQVCLYGYYAFGFKSLGRHYLKEIDNLINNKKRLDENENAYIEIAFEHVANTDCINYRIRRSWKWPNQNIEETITVIQDDRELNEEELVNFQNYLIHLIPPELLKLYFFDGEKVADYFLGNQAVNFREALMVLSGNDTFDILTDNIKKILKVSENFQGEAAQVYLEEKRKSEALEKEIAFIEDEIASKEFFVEDLFTQKQFLEKQYSEQGGVTIEEWTQLHGVLKEEEEKRERINWQRKSLATEVLPFLIAKDYVEKVALQVKEEKEFRKHAAVKESFNNVEFRNMLNKTMRTLGEGIPVDAGSKVFEQIQKYFYDQHWEEFVPLFGLSDDEEHQVQATLGKVQTTEAVAFKRYQKRLDASIKRSKEIRERINNSDIEHFEEYVRETTRLDEERKVTLVKIEQDQERLTMLKEQQDVQSSKMKSAKKAFEEQLKSQSVSALSGRVLLLLEDLQNVLYTQLIAQVQKDVNQKFEELIRKKDFFTEIKIDEDFSIHILRNQAIAKEDLLALVKGPNLNVIQKALGVHAVRALQERFGGFTTASLQKKIIELNEAEIILPVEIDKTRLSSGEKQIFVMSLYWAMMNQSKNDLPYVIDTPFARIDTEHRANITDHFFKNLNGQLMVLSTDEEISGDHIMSMKDQIARVYMLEYGQDKRTYIFDNQYFEV